MKRIWFTSREQAVEAAKTSGSEGVAPLEAEDRSHDRLCLTSSTVYSDGKRDRQA